MASLSWRRLIPFLVAVLVFGADQLTKAWAVSYFAHRPPNHYLEVVGSWVRLGYLTNTGAAFGIFQNRSIVFTIIAVAAIPIILLAQPEFRRYGWPGQLCLGLLLGGTLGNLVDRLRLGYVVDFVDLGVGTLRWPTFNLADSAFVIGVGFLCAYFLLDGHRG